MLGGVKSEGGDAVVAEHSMEPAPRVTVHDLRGGVRGLCALVGMGGLISGTTAVFESDNQAGTVALLAVGGIASLLAVVGKVPLRWVIGGSEFDMSEAAAQDIADAVASQLDPAGTAEVAGRLADSEAGARSPVSNAMHEYVVFEQAAIGRVMQAIAPRRWSYAHVTRPEDRKFDGFVVMRDGVQVPVEYKLVRSVAARRRFLALMAQTFGSAAPTAKVVVVSTAPTVPNVVTLGQRAELAPLGVHLVDADASDFERRFIAACEDALSQLQSREVHPD